jgi:hypothetical protein
MKFIKPEQLAKRYGPTVYVMGQEVSSRVIKKISNPLFFLFQNHLSYVATGSINDGYNLLEEIDKIQKMLEDINKLKLYTDAYTGTVYTSNSTKWYTYGS